MRKYCYTLEELTEIINLLWYKTDPETLHKAIVEFEKRREGK